jgi:hypothetical protein
MKRTFSLFALLAIFACVLPCTLHATALAANFSAPELAGENPVAQFVILNAEVMYAGGIAAIDYTDEAQMASNTAGLRVVGRVAAYVTNAADGQSVTIETGIFRYNNSATYIVARSAIGQPCYVEDDNTVGSWASNGVPAGLVRDVDASGVWVDMRPAALATARELAPAILVAKTDDYTCTDALAFQGRSAFRITHTGASALTLPSAVAGMRVGVMRGSATAADDVSVQTATGDKIQGWDAMSAAGKKIDNTVDAVSGILWLRAVDDTHWVIDNPVPADVASWVKNDT